MGVERANSGPHAALRTFYQLFISLTSAPIFKNDALLFKSSQNLNIHRCVWCFFCLKAIHLANFCHPKYVQCAFQILKGGMLPSPTPLLKKQMNNSWCHIEVLSEFSGTLLSGQRTRELTITVCCVKEQSISLQSNVKRTGFSCLCVGREPNVCCHLTWNQCTPVPTSCRHNLCHRHMSHPPDLHSRPCLCDSQDRHC